jgi:hypothetical protein
MTVLPSHVPRRGRAFATVVAAAALTLAAAMHATPGRAQSLGLPRDDVVRLLADRFAEAPVALGIAANGALVELFTSRDGATWTIIVTYPDGLSYLLASGRHWMPAPRAPGFET